MYDPKLFEIMTLSPKTLGPDDLVTKVDELFRQFNFHHIPIIDENKKVKGIVSKSDYLMLCNSMTLFRKEKEREKNLRLFDTLLVKEIMSIDVAKLKDTDLASDAVAYFSDNTFHAIPIINKDEKLVGIITPFDLIKYAYYPRFYSKYKEKANVKVRNLSS